MDNDMDFEFDNKDTYTAEETFSMIAGYYLLKYGPVLIPAPEDLERLLDGRVLSLREQHDGSMLVKFKDDKGKHN